MKYLLTLNSLLYLLDAKWVLDKNPEQILDNDLCNILNEFSNKNPNVVLCTEPFTKSCFLNELIKSVNFPIIFLDFDLLYSGYVKAEMISKSDKVTIYQPEKSTLKKILSEVAKKISEQKHLVIFDSFNGFYNLFSEIESGIFINTITMLFSSISKQKNSMIVVSAMARKKEEEGWILLPGGRHVVESQNSGMYYLKRAEKSLIFSSISSAESKKIFRIED